MMSDEEMVKTIAYLKSIVFRRYQRFSHVDELVDEVTMGLIKTLETTDLNNPKYRSYVCRGVLSHVSNYWYKNFWDKGRKISKPNATTENVYNDGKYVLDRMHDGFDNESYYAIRMDVQRELARLPKRERDIVTATFIDNEDSETLAAKYGISKQRISQICISAQILLSKRLAEYRGNRSAYADCKKCGGACRDGLPMCDTCRAVNRRETLRKTALRKKGIKIRVFKKGVAA